MSYIPFEVHASLLPWHYLIAQYWRYPEGTESSMFESISGYFVYKWMTPPASPIPDCYPKKRKKKVC